MSVAVDEFALQMAGYAAAFRHPEVVQAIESAGGAGIAVTLVQWADSYQQAVSIDWTWVGDAGQRRRPSPTASASPAAASSAPAPRSPRRSPICLAPVRGQRLRRDGAGWSTSRATAATTAAPA